MVARDSNNAFSIQPPQAAAEKQPIDIIRDAVAEGGGTLPQEVIMQLEKELQSFTPEQAAAYAREAAMALEEIARSTNVESKSAADIASRYNLPAGIKQAITQAGEKLEEKQPETQQAAEETKEKTSPWQALAGLSIFGLATSVYDKWKNRGVDTNSIDQQIEGHPGIMALRERFTVPGAETLFASFEAGNDLTLERDQSKNLAQTPNLAQGKGGPSLGQV